LNPELLNLCFINFTKKEVPMDKILRINMGAAGGPEIKTELWVIMPVWVDAR
jgi:hypothetical protein